MSQQRKSYSADFKAKVKVLPIVETKKRLI